MPISLKESATANSLQHYDRIAVDYRGIAPSGFAHDFIINGYSDADKGHPAGFEHFDERL